MLRLIQEVVWPPGYYILRDRIPFYLTVIYIYRDRIPKFLLTTLGWYLLTLSTFVTGVALGLYFKGYDMRPIVGTHWSPPSPIEWGSMIIVLIVLLWSRGTPIYEASYLSFIAALSGGWIYEFIPLLFYDNFSLFIFLKVNAIKVFMVEFQVLCLPILIYIIKTTKVYHISRLLIPTGALMTLFSVFQSEVMQWFQLNAGPYAYRWYVRLPTLLFLFIFMTGIKGDIVNENR